MCLHFIWEEGSIYVTGQIISHLGEEISHKLNIKKEKLKFRVWWWKLDSLPQAQKLCNNRESSADADSSKHVF